MEDKDAIKPATTITAAEFDKAVLSAPDPVLVYFFRKSCHGCQQLSPTIDEIARRFQQDNTGVQVLKCEDDQVMRRCKVFFVPQLVLFSQGQDHWIERAIKTAEDIGKEITRIEETMPLVPTGHR